jgi:hypothetical protein
VKHVENYGEQMRKASNFRLWVEIIWRENCEERKTWQEDQQSIAKYFTQYKWWLRKEFRFQTKKTNQ